MVWRKRPHRMASGKRKRMAARTQRLHDDVLFLTEMRPFRNHLNHESLVAVCERTEGTFREAGLQVERQHWMAGGREYTNIIGSYNPDAKRRLVVGAHYDVCGDQPGADDNASAVAGLLETARLLGELAPRIDHRIDLVAYCLEEPPYFASDDMGSYIHARSLHQSGADVIGMLCYEMIGYFTDGPQAYPEDWMRERYPPNGDFIIVVGIQEHEAFNSRVHALMRENAAIDVQVVHFDHPGGLAGMSDQRNYWRFGYPALMINDTSFVRNPHYHRPTDTIDTLDLPKMTEVVNGAYHAVTGIL